MPSTFTLENFIFVTECVVVCISVIGIFWAGIRIGREFGSLEKLILSYLDDLQVRLEGEDGGPEGDTLGCHPSEIEESSPRWGRRLWGS